MGAMSLPAKKVSTSKSEDNKCRYPAAGCLFPLSSPFPLLNHPYVFRMDSSSQYINNINKNKSLVFTSLDCKTKDFYLLTIPF